MTKGLIQYFTKRFPLLPLTISGLSLALGLFSFKHEPYFQIITFLSIALMYLCFLLHIRVVDDFKDYEYDTEHHKDRPVQQGSITKKMLVIMGVLNFILFTAIAFFVTTRSNSTYFIFYILTILYTGLMYKEFWIKDFFEKSPTGMLITHDFVFVILYSFFSLVVDNGAVFSLTRRILLVILLVIPMLLIEIGRKTAPRTNSETGEETNDTYHYQWGAENTVAVLGGLIISAGILQGLLFLTMTGRITAVILFVLGIALILFRKIYVQKLLSKSLVCMSFASLIIPIFIFIS